MINQCNQSNFHVSTLPFGNVIRSHKFLTHLTEFLYASNFYNRPIKIRITWVLAPCMHLLLRSWKWVIHSDPLVTLLVDRKGRNVTMVEDIQFLLFIRFREFHFSSWCEMILIISQLLESILVNLVWRMGWSNSFK